MRGTALAGWSGAATSARHRALILLSLVTVLVGVGCGGDDPEPADATATARAALPSPTPIPLEIGAITWTTDVAPDTGAPVDDLTSLPNDTPRVVAALHVPSLPAGTSVRAHWTIDGDPMPGLAPEPIVAEEPLEDAWLSWRLTWNAEEPWPIGTLGIRVEIDGEEVATEDIMIVRARS